MTNKVELRTSTTPDSTKSLGEKSSSGFFGRMRKSRKNSKRNTTPKGNNKKNSNATSTTSNDPKLAGRRVVKVSSTENIGQKVENTTITITTKNEEEEKEEKKIDHAATFAPTNKIPTVQDKVQREKTEQWRKERIDATAAIRKEKKEKEVMEHRRKEGTGTTSSTTTEAVGDATDGTKMKVEEYSSSISAPSETAGGVVAEPVPAILSAESKYPENKRKVSQDDHIGKKSKSEEEKEEEDEMETKKQSSSNAEDSSKIVVRTAPVSSSSSPPSSWADMKVTLSVVAVVMASAFVIASRMSRRR